MSKILLVSCLVALGFIPSVITDSAFAQRGPGPNRLRKGQKKIERLTEADPQFGRRNNRPQSPKQEQVRRLQQRLMQEIGLTPEQRMRMAEIRRGNEDEFITLGRRVRMARQALDRAIMNPQFDETLIRQRAEEFAAAQADRTRLQARVRAQVRSVLTTDQVIRFIELERKFRREMREQKEREQTEREKGMQGPGVSDPRAPVPSEEIDLISMLLSTL